MEPDRISFDEAEKLILKHGPIFGGRDVVGVGIAERDQQLKFIVAVANDKTRERLAQKYLGQNVSGFPVHVEKGLVKSLVGTGDSGLVMPGRTPKRASILRELVDRPGYLLVLGVVAAVIVFVLR